MTAVAVGTRERLLEVAERLIESHGPSGVTLREIARQAGVSHGAPLKHFPTLRHLLTDLAISGFIGLHDAVDAATTVAPPDAGTGERLARGCDAYIRYAVQRPGVFALMFRFDIVHLEVPELPTRAIRTWDQLVDLVAAHRATGWRSEVELLALAGAAWSVVHGAAQLWSTTALQSVTGVSDLDRQIDAIISMSDLPTFRRATQGPSSRTTSSRTASSRTTSAKTNLTRSTR